MPRSQMLALSRDDEWRTSGGRVGVDGVVGPPGERMVISRSMVASAPSDDGARRSGLGDGTVVGPPGVAPAGRPPLAPFGTR